MKISLQKVTKRYGYTPIIKDVSLNLFDNQKIGLSGANGSGKSTLIKMISGYLSQSTGTISYESNHRNIDRDEVYKEVSFAAPYICTSEQFTLKEHFIFYTGHKKLRTSYSYNQYLDSLEMVDPKDKYIQHFSSGMKQKILISFAILSDTQLLLLDEPTSFLDDKAKEWFHAMLENNRTNRTVVIASNDASDFGVCDVRFRIEGGGVVGL